LATAWALAGDVTLLATTEAGYRTTSTATGTGGVLCAFALDMAFLAAAVASWVALFWAVFRDMTLLVACASND
jgi:hypothetical protein